MTRSIWNACGWTKFGTCNWHLWGNKGTVLAFPLWPILPDNKCYNSVQQESTSAVVQWRNWKEEGLLSTLHRPSHGIQRALVSQSGCSLCSIGRGWKDRNLYSAVRINTNWVDLQDVWKNELDQELGKIECIFHCMIRWCLSTPVSLHDLLPIAQSYQQKCKSSIGCAVWKYLHAQLIGSFPWIPALRAAYSHL